MSAVRGSGSARLEGTHPAPTRFAVARDLVVRIAGLLEELDQELFKMALKEDVESVVKPAVCAIEDAMVGPGDKHPPFSYLREDENEHLFKAMRHIQSYMIQRDGYQQKDGEDHLSLALARVAMAMAKREAVK
jgi:hypothetical protein